jgi:hypothetical protein
MDEFRRKANWCNRSNTVKLQEWCDIVSCETTLKTGFTYLFSGEKAERGTGEDMAMDIEISLVSFRNCR